MLPAYASHVLSQPQNITSIVGGTATFTVVALGTPPLSYQWQFYETNLTDNGRISGSQSSSLTISNLVLGDAGNYQVIVANAYGSTNSDVATLTVTCPAITLGPSTLPAAALGVAYSQTLSASGGTEPYSFTNTGGSLPAGLSLSGGAVLSGTPSRAGTNAFTVTATDANGCTGSQAYTLTISGVPRPGIVSSSLSGTNLVIRGTNGLAGRPCCVLMSTNAALPLSQWVPIATNVLSGSGSFTITATNAVSPTASRRFFILQVQ